MMMKAILRPLFACSMLLFLLGPSQAQDKFYGMTATGGSKELGKIYSITESGTYASELDFTQFEGSQPQCDLLLGADGKYYGVTEFGGTNGVGLIFSYDPVTETYAVRANFTSATTGANPIQGLTLGRNGLYYGLCRAGGTNGVGTLYQFNPSTNALLVRVSFSAAGNGSTPRARLSRNADGSVLFGTCFTGGANNGGTIFRYGSISATAGANGPTSVTKLHDFVPGVGNTGSGPFRGVTLASNGKLYGMTFLGGAANGGVLFELNSTTPSAYTVLHDFILATGWKPFGEVMQASDGHLYGITSQGGTGAAGTIFKYDLSGPGYSVVQNLNNTTGNGAYGGMIQAANGLLYGMMKQGGTANFGTIFSFDRTTSTYTVLAELNALGLRNPESRLLEISPGVFIGTTKLGGTANSGCAFRFQPSTSTTTKLVSFGFSPGSGPKGKMLLASNGLFYGLAGTGGTNSQGVLFSFDPVTKNYVSVKDLGGTDGSFPEGDLIEVGGKIYGMCTFGGANNVGTIFEYTIATNTYVKKQDLVAVNGGEPKGGFVLAQDGFLYATTSTGGIFGQGTIIQYDRLANSLVVKYNLQGNNGSGSASTLLEASNGTLYGTCSAGGAFGDGTMFSFKPSTNLFNVVVAFSEFFNGAGPSGDLVQHPNGLIYGTTNDGGLYLAGGIFSYDIVNDVSLTWWDFNQTLNQGSNSVSNLVVTSNNRLVGTCSNGGSANKGTVVRFSPVDSSFSTLLTFTGANGSVPLDGMVRYTVPAPSGVQLAMKVFLDGPYDLGTETMNATLRTRPEFPLTEPFTSAGFTQIGGGGETIQPTVLTTTGNNAIVDWVLLELRSSSNNATIVQTRSALVQSDGDVVDTDGASPVTFNIASGNYYVAVRHRNHFGVLTLNTVALSASPTTLDLTTGAVATYGTNAQRVRNGRRTSYAGNVLRDDRIRYTGANNDRDPVLAQVGGTTPTATVQGYEEEDVNLDGTVKYTGSNNDRDPILTAIGGVVPTNTITEQLP